MNVNYDYYRIFYYAAKYKNFSRAAIELGTSQPNITRTINRLEEDLQCKLFLRNNRGIQLTPEGEELFSHVSIAIQQLQRGEQKLTDKSRLKSGSVSIGVSETALNIFLLNKLQQFHERYPGVRLKLVNYSTRKAIHALERGSIDLAVVTTPTELQSPMKEILLLPFHDILIGGTAFSFLKGQTLHLRDLANYPLIRLNESTMTYHFFETLFLSHKLNLKGDIEAATTDQLLSLVIHNIGIGFLPELYAHDVIQRGDIFQIPVHEKIPERRISLIYDSRHPFSSAAQAMEDLLVSDS
ncbi:DNA-binding transcriptional regulator, LysR family [Lachnospiraceae bacterium]|nr:DNA-binding transcriptional regulator, LysR family [Lachnospiraceae bacterium]